MRGVTAIARTARAAGCVEAADMIWMLVTLVDDFVDPDDCHYDHHGYCQAHYWFETSPPCPHARAKELLANRDVDGFVS